MTRRSERFCGSSLIDNIFIHGKSASFSLIRKVLTAYQKQFPINSRPDGHFYQSRTKSCFWDAPERFCGAPGGTMSIDQRGSDQLQQPSAPGGDKDLVPLPIATMVLVVPMFLFCFTLIKFHKRLSRAAQIRDSCYSSSAHARFFHMPLMCNPL